MIIPMKKTLFILFIFIDFIAIAGDAQTQTDKTWEEAINAPAMQFDCPENEEAKDVITSLDNKDPKVYANNLKEKFGLARLKPTSPNTSVIANVNITINNPMYYPDNLLEYIYSWINGDKSWRNTKINKDEKCINSEGYIKVATHERYFNINYIYINPSLSIKLKDTNTIEVILAADTYKNEEYGSSTGNPLTSTVPISRAFPFNQKSSYKISYSKALVGTYQFFCDFISSLQYDLNTHFSKDTRMLTLLHYKYSRDSLKTLYGEPTKIIVLPNNNLSVNNDIYFFEGTKKVFILGKTIDFKDIVDCELSDDPTIIPGETTSSGNSITIFGIGLGGTTQKTTPDRTIHHYVVKLKLDNLKSPLIYITTGDYERLASEVLSSFEYVLNHKNDRQAIKKPQGKKVVRRGRR